MKLRNLILLLCPLAMTACDFLDYDETNGLKTKEDVYKYYGDTKAVLTNVYHYLPQDFGAIGGAMRDCGSDDAEFAKPAGIVQNFTNGSWSATNPVDDSWTLYKGIRVANAFIADLQNIDWSRFEYNGNYHKWMENLKIFEPQARILRATYFFELARRYGDIPMPLEVLDLEGDRTISKTAFSDVINFIVQECDTYGKLLPESYKKAIYDNEVGRVTKGYAMALKSKALLYAASELHNPEMNTEKWKASVAAAWDLMQTNLYQLDPAGVANRPDSKEGVLILRNNNNSDFELKNFPIRFTRNRPTPATGTFPSQNLVDAFETINGYAVTLTPEGFVSDDPAFDPQNPYANRDPRFARTILADGMAFKGDKIDVKNGGKDYLPVLEGGTPTGYYLKKYIQESTSFELNNESPQKHSWVNYRYAETLLTYAESMVYAFGDPNYKDKEYTKSALEALNEVRANAGMPAKTVSGKEEFIKVLRNEWRVEFAFEDHRFWDVRRWKIGNETQRTLYGVQIEEGAQGKTYRRTLYENRQWRECMNLYPIPQEKLFVNSNLNPQNAGW